MGCTLYGNRRVRRRKLQSSRRGSVTSKGEVARSPVLVTNPLSEDSVWVLGSLFRVSVSCCVFVSRSTGSAGAPRVSLGMGPIPVSTVSFSLPLLMTRPPGSASTSSWLRGLVSFGGSQQPHTSRQRFNARRSTHA